MKPNVVAVVFAVFVMVCLSGCSSGGVTPQTATVTPSSADLLTGQTQQFSTNIDTNSAKLTWAVNGMAGGDSTVGTIDSTGLYTAPAAQVAAPVMVSATKTSNSKLTASASVTVVGSGTVTSTANSQVALYTIAPPVAAAVTIQFGTDTTYGLNTWTQNSAGNAAPLATFVAGMKAKTQYHMRASLLMPDGTTLTDSDHTFTTGSLPATLIPAITVSTPNNLTPQPGVQMLDLLQTTAPAATTVDLQGNVLWYYQPGGTAANIVQPVKPLTNGHYLVTVSPNSTTPLDATPPPPGTLDETREIDLAGNIVKSITLVQLNQRLASLGFNYTALTIHHDALVLPNGHWILLINSTRVFTDLPGRVGTPITVLGDAIVDLDTNLNPVWLWDSFDHLDIDREPYLFPDWTHANALLYSASDGNLLLSIRHQSWIIKIDYNNGAGAGDILWHLGYQGDFTFDGTATGGTAPLDWFSTEHGPSFTTSNTSGQFGLAVFDNGDNRQLPGGESCTAYGQTPCPFSTAQVYTLDETALTATQTFLYAPNTYSNYGGNAEVLANNDVEFDLCTVPGGTTIQTSTYEMTQDATPQVVWQMTISGANAYRSFRMPSLYPGVQW